MRDFLTALQQILIYRRFSWRDLHVVLVFLVLGFPVLIDLLSGFIIEELGFDLSLGLLFRGALVAILLPCLILTEKFWVKLLVILMILLWLAQNIVWMETLRNYYLPREVLYFAKVLFVWVIYAYLAIVIPRYSISLTYAMQCVSFFGYLAGTAIIFSYFTGYGISTYERTDIGAVKSYFSSQNDIGLAMLVSIPMSLYFFVARGQLFYAVVSLLTLAGLVLLGTRAGLLGGIASFAAFIGFYTLGSLDKRNVSAKRTLLIIVMLVAVAGIGSYAISFISEYRYLQEKYADLLEESPRENLEEAGARHLETRSMVHDVFGEGSVGFALGVLKYYQGVDKVGADGKSFKYGKPVEQDLYDIFGAYGLLLGSLIIFIIVLILIRAILGLVASPNLLHFAFFLSMAFFTFHSFVAGHAISSPTVSAPLALIYYFLLHRVRLPVWRKSRLPMSIASQ